MHRPFSQRAGYNLLRFLCRLYGVLVFRVRCRGRRAVPPSGAVLVCANHQSYLDPVLVGLACDRRLNYLARESLFRWAPFRWLIRFLDAIPVDRDGGGLTGLRESLRRIRRGEMVLIFPEGTRTTDGEVGPLESGFCLLARRAKVTLLPVGLDGSFEAWPRQAWLPRPAVIHVCIGQPIGPEFVQQVDDEQLVAELSRRIRTSHAQARAARQAAQAQRCRQRRRPTA